MEIEEQTRRKNVHLSEKIGDLELQIDALTSQNKDEQTVAFVQQVETRWNVFHRKTLPSLLGIVT